MAKKNAFGIGIAALMICGAGSMIVGFVFGPWTPKAMAAAGALSIIAVVVNVWAYIVESGEPSGDT
jgi:membrane protein YdbS with pleckstrin-like domain